jgi:type IV pilus assembly protein PilE
MTHRRTDRRGHGFTLIELMIALAIAAILASVAYPSYLSQVAKGRRADGKQALVELAQKLERFYTERGTYAGATLGGAGGLYPAVSPGGFYALTVSSQTADGFVIAAAPRGNQLGDACSTLGYNQLGDRSVDSGATLTVDQCW